MTDYAWPTAPVIRARWRNHGYTNPDPTPIAHTTIRCIKDNQLLRWMVVVTPPGGPQLPVLFSTYQQAIDWVANELYSQ